LLLWCVPQKAKKGNEIQLSMALVENPWLIYKMRVFLYYYFYSHTGKKHITKHRKIL